MDLSKKQQKDIIKQDNIDKAKIIDHLNEIHEMFLVLKLMLVKHMNSRLREY